MEIQLSTSSWWYGGKLYLEDSKLTKFHWVTQWLSPPPLPFYFALVPISSDQTAKNATETLASQAIDWLGISVNAITFKIILIGEISENKIALVHSGVHLGIKTCEVFLCFVTIMFVLYCFDFFVFFVLRHLWRWQVFTPRMSPILRKIPALLLGNKIQKIRRPFDRRLLWHLHRWLLRLQCRWQTFLCLC